jgi:hypothetical protein
MGGNGCADVMAQNIFGWRHDDWKVSSAEGNVKNDAPV